jgi:hypothetical protein
VGQSVSDGLVSGGAVDEAVEASASKMDRAGTIEFVDRVDVRHHEPRTEGPIGRVIFVTDDGNWVGDGSDEFHCALGDPNPDYNAPLFAIKNLGFISVRICGDFLVDITLHPRNVALQALRSLEDILPSIQSHLFRITYLKDAWSSEIAPSVARTICRLSELCAIDGAESLCQDRAALLH